VELLFVSGWSVGCQEMLMKKKENKGKDVGYCFLCCFECCQMFQEFSIFFYFKFYFIIIIWATKQRLNYLIDADCVLVCAVVVLNEGWRKSLGFSSI
jgi:hypothetical protein